MKYAFLLSKENLAMAIAEVISLANKKPIKTIDNLILLDITQKTKDFLVKRLALTKKIYKFLFSAKEKDLISSLQNYNWNKIYKKDFCVRIESSSKTNFTEKQLAGPIWRKLTSPKVNLSNPSTGIHFIFSENSVICCLLENELKQDFNTRKSHNRPEPHPTSLSPKLAKCLINLTGIKKGKLVDLFCGSGGILIEAGLMGLIPIGYDIDGIMVNRAKANLNFFEIKEYKLTNKDALKVNEKISYLVSDLPYGKNTRQKELKALCSSFIPHLKKILIKKAVIIFPVFKNKVSIDCPPIIKSNNLRIIHSFDFYIHKSLSKKIFVIEPKKLSRN
jgi:tRNA (guanine10-N2)-dimethyltransferase